MKTRLKRLSILLTNGIMGALAVGQIALLLCLYFREGLPLPNPLIAAIEEQFRAQGASIAVGSYRVDLDGRIDIRELRIYGSDRGELLAQSDWLTLELDLPSLLHRKVTWNAIDLGNARLHCPAIYSSSGTDETFASEIHATLRRSGRLWSITHLNLRLHNLIIGASGELAGLPGAETNRPYIESFLSFCQTASSWQVALNNLKNPVAHVVFEAPVQGAPIIDVEVIGEGLTVSSHLMTGPFRFHTSGLQFPNLDMSSPARLEITSAQFADRSTSGRIFAEYKTDALLKDDLRGIEYLRFASTRLRTEHLAIDDVIGVIHPAAFPILSGRLALYADDATLDLRGNFDLARGSGRLQFDSSLQITELLENPLLKKYAIDRVVAFPERPQIRGQLELEDGFNFSRLDFDIRANPFLMRGARFERFAAKGRIDEERMRIERILFETPQYSATGSLQRNFASGRFRLLMSGTLFPADLNTALPDWWDRIWTGFSFSDHPPSGDYDIVVDTLGKRVVYIFGSAEAHGCAYSDLTMSRTRLKTYGVDGRLEIFDIEAERAEGRGSGSLTFLYEGKHNTHRLIDLETNFHLSELSGLFGEGFSKVAQDFTLTNPPQLKLTGALFDRHAPPGQQRDVRISAESRGPLKYRQIDFDWLAFDGRISENQFSFEPLRFGYANGRAEGALRFAKGNFGNRLSIAFDLVGADQKRSLETIGFFGETGERKKKGNRAVLSPGILGLQLEVSGDPADYLSFEGSGVLAIENPQLARVHLFGGLSRLLAGTWIDFTTLKLTKAHGQFQLHRDRLTFKPLTFTGANSTIRAVGDLRFPGQEINFRVRMTYLKKPGNPIATVLTPILKPIGEALEFEMTGTYRKPKWRSFVAPRNPDKDL